MYTFIHHDSSKSTVKKIKKNKIKIKNRQTYSTYTIMAYVRKHIHKKLISIA